MSPDRLRPEPAVRELAGAAAEVEVAGTLLKLVREDPFWAVRLAAPEVPRLDVWRESKPLFQEAARGVDSRVRRTAIRRLGELGHQDLAPFFLERFPQDDSYLVQAETLTALGRT